MQTGCTKLIIAPSQESEKDILRESLRFSGLHSVARFVVLRLAGRWLPAYLRKSILGKGGFDLLLAIEDRINLAVLLGSRVVAVEGFIDGAENDMKWNAGVLPAFYQRPIQGGDEHMLAAPAHELFLDLGEVVEVVQTLGGRSGAIVDAVQWG